MNRGVLITPFHNMALMSPVTQEADVDRHTAVFREAIADLLAGPLTPAPVSWDGGPGAESFSGPGPVPWSRAVRVSGARSGPAWRASPAGNGAGCAGRR